MWFKFSCCYSQTLVRMILIFQTQLINVTKSQLTSEYQTFTKKLQNLAIFAIAIAQRMNVFYSPFFVNPPHPSSHPILIPSLKSLERFAIEENQFSVFATKNIFILFHIPHNLRRWKNHSYPWSRIDIWKRWSEHMIWIHKE